MKQTSQLFKALSDDTRLRILGLLLQGELCVCDLVAVLGLPQSTVSRHLACLRNSGLVNDNRKGVWMHYSLAQGETSMQRDTIEMLRKRLAGIPQIQADQKALKKFLAEKAATCG
ncbi:MAG: winged helix-turn-helix transcriptional regulator [Thermoleophilia bacterium]|nr:winged helix-turn-helix transcriptional regulator [Thermoleophilia bacterium]